MESGLRFIDRKQEEHKKEFGVYADTCHKLGEWCEEYAKQYRKEQVTLGFPSVSNRKCPKCDTVNVTVTDDLMWCYECKESFES
jgi:hypothetical protein